MSLSCFGVTYMKRIVLFAGVLFAIAGACSSDSGGGGSSNGESTTLQSSGGDTCEYRAVEALTPVPVSEAQLTAEFAPLFCQVAQTCCLDEATPYDPAGCEAVAAERLTPLPGYVFDAKTGAQCLQGLREAANTQACMGGLPSPCFYLYRGMSAPGQACATNSDCAIDARGITTCNLVEAICELDIRAKAGDPCTDGCSVASVCLGGGDGSFPDYIKSVCWHEDGLTCEIEGCVALPGVGQDCTIFGQCNMQGRCDEETDKCVPRLAIGEGPCTGDTDCVAGSHCADGAPRVCTKLLQAGSACTESQQCCGGCIGGEVCTLDIQELQQGTFRLEWCGPEE